MDTENTEVKILVSQSGALFAMLPDGEVRTILVDVHGEPNYGFLTIGYLPLMKDEQSRLKAEGR